MWQNIASLYTAARNRGEPGLVLEEFIETELAKHSHPTTPEKLLREAGFVPKAPIDKEAADKAAARRKARATPKLSSFSLTRVYLGSEHQLSLTEDEAADILRAFDPGHTQNSNDGDSQPYPHVQHLLAMQVDVTGGGNMHSSAGQLLDQDMEDGFVHTSGGFNSFVSGTMDSIIWLLLNSDIYLNSLLWENPPPDCSWI